MKNDESAFPSINIPEVDYYGHPIKPCNSGMTPKQYAAIQLKVPRSGDPEIDGMIRESRRAEFAGQVLKGLFSGNGFVDKTQAAYLAEQCHISADIMLAEWEKEAGE
jgi:hypothetical protein